MSACLVVAKEVLAAASSGSCRVFGRVRPGEGLIQILSSEADSGFDDLGHAAVGHVSEDRAVVIETEWGPVQLVLGMNLPLDTSVEVVALTEGIASRRSDTGTLGDKQVVLVGAGSVGSLAGVLLAQAGVGRFRVTDNDRLDATNLSRHVCDLADLGRSKAVAVAEAFRRRVVQADALELDVLHLSDNELDAIVGCSDLVVATTDSPTVQFLVNESCIRTSHPGVFAGAYELAAGGEVISVRPGQGPCLYCTVGFRTSVMPGIETRERRQAYQDSEQNKMIAEPGLGADTALLASVTAMHALAILDAEGSRAALLSSGRFLLFHGGSSPRGHMAELFRRPFEFISARVVRTDPCPVCGWKSDDSTKE